MDFLLPKIYTCKICRGLSFQVYFPTRMHSSRMRTACLLPVSPSMHCYGGCMPGGGVPARGCTCSGVYLPRWVYIQSSWAGTPQVGTPLGRGCTCLGGCTCPGGVYLPGGCTYPGGTYLGGSCPGGLDVPARGLYLPRGVYLPGEVYLPRYCPPCEQNS